MPLAKYKPYQTEDSKPVRPDFLDFLLTCLEQHQEMYATIPRVICVWRDYASIIERLIASHVKGAQIRIVAAGYVTKSEMWLSIDPPPASRIRVSLTALNENPIGAINAAIGWWKGKPGWGIHPLAEVRIDHRHTKAIDKILELNGEILLPVYPHINLDGIEEKADILLVPRRDQ